MKLPKIFIPNKSLDEDIEKMLKTEKVLKHREIEDIYSLLNLPEDIGGYHTYPQKTEDKKIPAYQWHAHFESLLFDYLTEAGKVNCFKRRSAFHDSVIIYSLNFPNDSELDKLINRADVAQVFSYIKYDKYKDWIIECLKKDGYIVAILINKELENDSKFFKNWYVDKFGMVEV